MMKPTRRDYCQFLISTQTNYTQTYFADHHPHFSHDAIIAATLITAIIERFIFRILWPVSDRLVKSGNWKKDTHARDLGICLKKGCHR